MKTVWINAWKMWKLGLQGAPKWVIGSQLIMGTLDVVPIVLSIVATTILFDQAVAIYAQEASTSAIIWPIIFFATMLISRAIINVLSNYTFATAFRKMEAYLAKLVAEKSAKLEPITYEDPKLLDEINKATNAVPFAFRMGTMIIGNAIMVATFGLGLGIYLYFLNPLLTLALVFAFAPKMLALTIQTPLYSKLEDKSGALRRESSAYEEAMSGREFAKETRMLGAFDFFQAKYLNVVKRLNLETWRADSKVAAIDLLMSLMTGIGYLAIIYLLFVSLQSGVISVGEFAAVFGGVATWVFYIVDNMTVMVEMSMKNVGGVTFFLKFLELPEQVRTVQTSDSPRQIQIKNVNFTYPNAAKPSLRNLNLTIQPGETIAIVGENGAGKSTLTKLLLGIYEPTEGEVTGIPDRASAVFQKFQRYQLKLCDNITLSNISDTSEIAPVLEKAGVAVNSESYPQGADTILSREFDGVDLSGGQWQRVAIARGLYRQHDLIVLDEPTAAIDPIEESRLYEKFAELAQDKTAIIVTHRLGSAKITDRIIVMDRGEIVQIGTHQELVSAEGLYQKMYQAQEAWYMSA